MLRQHFVPLMLVSLLLFGCGSDLPFDYSYRSPSEVDIIMNGQTYTLRQGEKLQNLPFSYEFEADGDVNIMVGGDRYELESPYDIDSGKKKKKTAKSAKKSTKTTNKK